MRRADVDLMRVLAIALIDAPFAAIAEVAVVGHVDRVGNRTGDAVKTIHVTVDNGLRRHKADGVGMAGVVEYFGSGTALNDTAGVHDDNVIRHLGDNAEVVGDQHDTGIDAILQGAQQVVLFENTLDSSARIGVTTEARKIKTLTAVNKSGTAEYAVGSVVDATGDCDIAAFAGAPTDTFKQGNVLAGWYYHAGAQGYRLKILGAADTPEEERTGKEKMPILNRRFTGLDGKELSEMTCLSHGVILEDWLKRREDDPTAAIATIATTPQIRMTRRIVGEYTLAHTEEHKFFSTSIGMVSNWKKRGPIYEVPFETLYGKAVKNLIAAGRCTSVTETLWDVMRVIPCCAVTGQAAGTAAAMTDDFSALDVALLQEKLQRNGVVLHERDILGGKE